MDSIKTIRKRIKELDNIYDIMSNRLGISEGERYEQMVIGYGRTPIFYDKKKQRELYDFDVLCAERLALQHVLDNWYSDIYKRKQ